MISKIEGKIILKGDSFVVVDISGIGFKVSVLNNVLANIKESIFLWTYLAVRENSLDLYGFLNKEELSFFEKLIEVPGIGPKSALSILNIASIDTLKKAIKTSDFSYLTKVSGIGKKTAEKIVFELRDKLEESDKICKESLRRETDVLEALKSLGYSLAEAREALKETDPKIEDTKTKIKEALKILSNK